jgi:hypothetical protein
LRQQQLVEIGTTPVVPKDWARPSYARAMEQAPLSEHSKKKVMGNVVRRAERRPRHL